MVNTKTTKKKPINDETPEKMRNIIKEKFKEDLKVAVQQLCIQINHYVAGCDTPFTYTQVSDVQEHLREIEQVLGI